MKMSLYSFSLVALLIATLLTGAKSFSVDCSPEQFEIHFRITGFENGLLSNGFGLLHTDLKEKNITLLNVTLTNDGIHVTQLYLSDIGANRSYVYNVSTGECTIDQDMGNDYFTYFGPVYLGLGVEKLEAMIFKSQAGEDNITTVVSKNFCIPIQAQIESATSLKVISFFNATIGIQDPKVFLIHEICRRIA